MKKWSNGRKGRSWWIKFSHLDVGHVGCFVHCSAFSGKEVFCDRVQNVRAVNLDLEAFPKMFEIRIAMICDPFLEETIETNFLFFLPCPRMPLLIWGLSTEQ